MDYLTLVNKDNLIKEKNLKKLKQIEYLNSLGEKIQVEKTTLDAYLKLEKFLRTKKIEIGIDDGFRSFAEQQSIYEKFVFQYGKEYAKKFAAEPGYSEHHTGMALDLNIKINGQFSSNNSQLMESENVFLEIHKYLKDFGFILRYPKEKETITGYPYEPWHIRYVGVVPATIMYQNQLTLEEYLKDYSGVLVVNKEKNMTSRDVVNEVSKVLGIKKIGHTGTLDPMAEGVLVLTIGKATKLGEILTSSEKEYIAGVEIGTLTDTLDMTGNIVKQKKLRKEINYQALIKSFQKTYLQEVPIYSAIKVNGKKLYEYARNNEKVKIPKKEVTIKEIKLLEQNKNMFKFQCLVTKGTYIRSLIRDMGESIGEYFSMSSLLRTKQGKFSIKDAYTLNDVKSNQFKILKIEEVLDYPNIILEKELLKKVRNGVRIKNQWNIKDKVVFKDKNNKLLVIYQKEKNDLKIDKMIHNSFI